MKNYLIKSRKIKLDNIEVVQNWQNEEAFIDYEISSNQVYNGIKPFTFMYLGNIGPVAGVDLLIDAFAQAGIDNCRLIIAGAGSEKKVLEEKVKIMGLSNVEFWSVPNGKVPEIQSQADVMLLPIKKGAASSSIPSKLPAYMFSKRPIIACVDQDSDTAKVIIAANAGWVLVPENVSALSKMMQQGAILSKHNLKEIGENGFNYALENLSKKKNLEKVIKCIINTIR